MAGAPARIPLVIEHRPGKKHGNADTLSRRPCPSNCKHCIVTAQPEDKWSPAAIRKDQLADKDLKPILEWKEAGTGRPPWPDVSDKGVALKSY
ncbi:hypothetical protein NQ318_015758 [Aromia moschata]|uniref:Uncharacterized protein n=1 Tax=Aromia moschata TaxID=1265417 RepID=A0AAV8XP73_9CUCU|nr:hypothetical protein NQ318_015758 [Aromia moschata]